MGRFHRKYPKKKVTVTQAVIEEPVKVLKSKGGVKVVLTPPVNEPERRPSDTEVEHIAKVISGMSDADIRTFVEHTARGGDHEPGGFAILGAVDLSSVKARMRQPEPAPAPSKPAPAPKQGTHAMLATDGKTVYKNVVGLIVIEDGKQVIKWL